ncbi:MAG TPA: hypothetical protein PKW55_02630 [Spirochaetota bacterium]|nr:hypothetical protein [Spirochaetota bacterium]HOM38255.1 hypothetical protein [Spirochaetota bacterium]HPQ48527.1 hypothetical protein [Spirochaetota bacterium]
MNKKNLLFLFLFLSLIVAIVITFVVDIHTSQYKDNLVNFHEKINIYVDTYFTDELIPNIKDTKYAEELKEKVAKITEIIGEIEPNLITSGARTKDMAELETKTFKAREGIDKILKIINEIESSMPEDVKASYNSEDVKKLKEIIDTLPTGSVTGKKVLRLVLILALGITGGIVFIIIEKNARKSGEIKLKDVA